MSSVLFCGGDSNRTRTSPTQDHRPRGVAIGPAHASMRHASQIKPLPLPGVQRTVRGTAFLPGQGQGARCRRWRSYKRKLRVRRVVYSARAGLPLRCCPVNLLFSRNNACGFKAARCTRRSSVLRFVRSFSLPCWGHLATEPTSAPSHLIGSPATNGRKLGFFSPPLSGGIGSKQQ